jgi:anti-anti-sigma regulatory factor/anti-sigma regulatory factor (Ser/Thr protein kinase)
MMTRPQLDIAITTREGATIVTPSGLLNVATAPQLRDALLKCIADQPSAVIADLNALKLQEAYTLSVFTVVARRTTEWSGVPLILVAGLDLGPWLDLHARAIARFLPVFRDLGRALRSVRQPPPRLVTRLRLTAQPHSAATARRLAAATCDFWDCAELGDDAATLASELTANAILHARTDAELRLEFRRGLLTVALSDGSPEPPRLETASEHELRIGGFGLQIVDALASTWGWSARTDGGKVVWAVLRADPSPAVRRPARPLPAE